jgi:(2Fe-2S) ferredoxin
MGLCGKGPNVLIYPQKVWFSETTIGDIGKVVETVDGFLSDST